jgi:hypothetical protein
VHWLEMFGDDEQALRAAAERLAIRG